MVNGDTLKFLASIGIKMMNESANEDERVLFLDYVNYLTLLCEEMEKTAPEIMKQAANKVLGTLPIFKYSETMPEGTIIN